jgi:hypothetical protein
LASLLLVMLSAGVHAQRIRPTVAEPGFQGGVPERGVVPSPISPAGPLGAAGGASLQQPRFDPYSTAPDAAATAPSLLGPPAGVGSGSTPAPFWQAPSTPGALPGYSATTPGYSTSPPATYPQQPPVLFPNGFQLSHPGWPQAQPGPYLRLFQDLRFRYTWLAGDEGPEEMDINEVEVATTVNFPNFLWSGLPLHVSPVFIFDFWEGPETDPVLFPTELPSRVYSALLNFRWQPMFTPMLGADLDVDFGVFSDFDTVTKDSLRLLGTGVLVLGLTPTVTVKVGATYLDRVDLKLLPAAGILWTPNPQTRFDIFFPKPKLAQYLTTLGNTDVWWYVNGEYGGSSWTVDRAGATGDARMDINDIRVGGGLEWTGHRGWRGFVETAYVLDREIVFADGTMNRDLKDTIMVRAGLAY